MCKTWERERERERERGGGGGQLAQSVKLYKYSREVLIPTETVSWRGRVSSNQSYPRQFGDFLLSVTRQVTMTLQLVIASMIENRQLDSSAVRGCICDH